MKGWSLVFFLFICGLTSKAQLAQDTTYNAQQDFSLSAFPIVFFLPETGLAFGGAGIMVFNAGKNKAWRKSQIQLGLAYTLKNQFLLFIPYELNIGQRWKIAGELGYYRYFYNFYGIGISSQAQNLETYDANFPRLINTVSYRISEQFLIGLQNKLDIFQIPNVGTLLEQQNPIGINGGIVSTVGLSASWDNRDDIFYPSKGTFTEVIIEKAGSYTASDFNYHLFQIDSRLYLSILDDHILASNLYMANASNNAPFFIYPYISSGKRGRGFADRRFIDRNMLLFQSEYRFPIYKRLRGALFGSYGTVSPSFNGLFSTRFRASYGAGLRFQLSKKQKSNLRVDVASSSEGIQFYLTIGEAF